MSEYSSIKGSALYLDISFSYLHTWYMWPTTIAESTQQHDMFDESWPIKDTSEAVWGILFTDATIILLYYTTIILICTCILYITSLPVLGSELPPVHFLWWIPLLGTAVWGMVQLANQMMAHPVCGLILSVLLPSNLKKSKQQLYIKCLQFQTLIKTV